MTDTRDPDIDFDARLLVRWMSELASAEPDAVVVASLEQVAEERGWHPYDAWHALIGRGDFAADLHPRGRDGKFIEKLGLVELFDVKGLEPGQRGKVTSIDPSKKTPGRPDVLVQLLDPKTGKPTRKSLIVKPDQISAAPEKARLDKSGPDVDLREKKPSARKMATDAGAADYAANPDKSWDVLTNDAQTFAWAQPSGEPTRIAQDYIAGWQNAQLKGKKKAPAPTPKPRPPDAFGSPAARPAPPAPETPEARERRLAAEEVRGATDEELARQRTLGPDVWRNAVAKEQANRAARRAQDDVARQKLIADVNTAAAELSTTDPEARAEGLDKILAKLRWSIIDTDKVHDHIYPPGESGRWSPERAAQHEAMWDDLLSQVEAAGVPQEHDALVLGGLPGAGKSFMLKPGQKAAGFGVVSWEPNGPLPEGTTHVSINPDIVKEMLISRGMLPEGISPDLKPMEQVTFLHEESSYVAKLFSQRLGDLGYNVVLDNTMDSEGGMLKRMTPLARQGYKFRGIFADIPQEESLASARKRYIDAALTPEGGRFVPSSVQGNRASTKGTMSKNRDAMDTLVADDWFTEYMIVDNTGVSQRNPRGEVVAQGTGGGTAADRYLPGADQPSAVPAPPATPTAPAAPAPAAPAAPAAV